jgi:pimeloyl-ACP methyl ester carboxylesterase
MMHLREQSLKDAPMKARKVSYVEIDRPRPRRFFLYRPLLQNEAAPLVVSVHGITRNAGAHAFRLAQQAERFGVCVVAPLFDKDTYGQYQQLLDLNTGARADHALLDIIDAARRITHAHDDKVLLFGYSGGAQFSHRFVLAHPHRVKSAVHVAAGWYTFPNSARYPFGLGRPKRGPNIALHLEMALRVPQHVMVGEGDTERDAALRQSERLDARQGRTRLERAQNWVRAMSAAGAQHSPAISPTLTTLPNVAHSYVQAVELAGLPQRVFERFETDAGLAPSLES